MTLKELWHRLGSPRWFFGWSAPLRTVLGLAALVLLVTGTAWGLVFAPADYQQGNSFRIIYVHVPSAIVAQSAYLLLGAAGVVLLVWRMKLADMVLEAAVPFGLSMTALALFTGAAWGKPTWGTWWEWDGRLTSMLVLLFLYAGYIALTEAAAREGSSSRIAAIFGMVGAVNVPIINRSVVWWNSLHQPPSITAGKSAIEPTFLVPLLIAVLGFSLLFGGIVLMRMRTLIADAQVEARLRRQALDDDAPTAAPVMEQA